MERRRRSLLESEENRDLSGSDVQKNLLLEWKSGRLVKDLEQAFVVRCSAAEVWLVSKLISADLPFFES